MSVFSSVSKKVSNTAKSAAKKSGDMIEISKLNKLIDAEEESIRKIWQEIGKVVYTDYKAGEEIPLSAKAFCDGIRISEKKIDYMKLKILELKSLKRCPGCSEELDIQTAFCPKCGTKQKMPGDTEEASETVDNKQ